MRGWTRYKMALFTARGRVNIILLQHDVLDMCLALIDTRSFGTRERAMEDGILTGSFSQPEATTLLEVGEGGRGVM